MAALLAASSFTTKVVWLGVTLNDPSAGGAGAAAKMNHFVAALTGGSGRYDSIELPADAAWRLDACAGEIADHVASRLPARSSVHQTRSAAWHRDQPQDESERQAAVHAARLVDRAGDPRVHAVLVDLREALGTQAVAVELIDGDRAWFAAADGTDLRQQPRADAICDLVIRRDRTLAIDDARSDPRTLLLGSVTGAGGVRAYVGHPIESLDGLRIGALCAFSSTPRGFTAADVELVQRAALEVQRLLVDLAWSRRDEPVLPPLGLPTAARPPVLVPIG